MAAVTYVPRHRSDAPLASQQMARETVAEIRLRNGQPNVVRARRGAYGVRFVGRVAVAHPDDRLPLGLAATTEQEAA